MSTKELWNLFWYNVSRSDWYTSVKNVFSVEAEFPVTSTRSISARFFLHGNTGFYAIIFTLVICRRLRVLICLIIVICPPLRLHTKKKKNIYIYVEHVVKEWSAEKTGKSQTSNADDINGNPLRGKVTRQWALWFPRLIKHENFRVNLCPCERLTMERSQAGVENNERQSQSDITSHSPVDRRTYW